MSAPVTYIPRFVEDPTELLKLLIRIIPWERRDDAPRCEFYMNDILAPYTYGKGRGRRTYQAQPYDPFPEVRAVRRKLEAHTGLVFEACFLNRYLDQSDHLGWHADDSPEMDDARPIATISLGAEREIWFKPKVTPNALSGSLPKLLTEKEAQSTEKLLLENGSCCLMEPGMQDTWYHRIPKASFQCGERISMVFRGYVGTP